MVNEYEVAKFLLENKKEVLDKIKQYQTGSDYLYSYNMKEFIREEVILFISNHYQIPHVELDYISVELLNNLGYFHV